MKSISFKDTLIPSVMNGTKTMTRRLFIPMIPEGHAGPVKDGVGKYAQWIWQRQIIKPRYQPGDIIYVKETHYVWGYWVKNGKTKSGAQAWKFVPQIDDNPVRFDRPIDVISHHGIGWHKRNARFMPAKYARTFLRVTDVRAERLNEISEEDAIAEGAECGNCLYKPKENKFQFEINQQGKYRDGFQFIWESIHGPGTFDDRWVWVIKFEKINKP